MEYLEKNLSTFTAIFEDFNIPVAHYRLLAGFDEDLLQSLVLYLQQIHVLVLSEPADMDTLLQRLSSALGTDFTAIVYTDKSTYHLPSDLSDFTKMAHNSTQKADALPSATFSLSSSTDTGGESSLRVGAPDNQGSNGNGQKLSGSQKGKEREGQSPDRFTPDPSKEGKGDGGLESPGPESGGSRDAQIMFSVTSHLIQQSEPFQDINVVGELTTKVYFLYDISHIIYI